MTGNRVDFQLSSTVGEGIRPLCHTPGRHLRLLRSPALQISHEDIERRPDPSPAKLPTPHSAIFPPSKHPDQDQLLRHDLRIQFQVFPRSKRRCSYRVRSSVPWTSVGLRQANPTPT